MEGPAVGVDTVGVGMEGERRIGIRGEPDRRDVPPQLGVDRVGKEAPDPVLESGRLTGDPSRTDRAGGGPACKIWLKTV